MGAYLNCGNEAFRQIRNDIYIDKTGLIDYVNSTIGTKRCMTCFSRPRRFGKSYAAAMLAAYYDRSCDSQELFAGLEISKSKTYEKYLNKFDVIYLDITRFISTALSLKNIIREIQEKVIRELMLAYPQYVKRNETILADALLAVAEKTNRKFILIIDEWDALFREAKLDDALQKEYVQFLRGLFKGGPSTDKTIAAAYMTGILPIKKYGTESALTDFREFTMTLPGRLARYVGFTEGEVRELCLNYDLDFENTRKWYDGYSFNQESHVYSPNSVMRAVENREIGNYWTRSETYESLLQYIDMNYDGLKDAIISMLGGRHIRIETLSF
ncbi:MAG: AAA family ATPase, partial [Lachnospiraceae bacterium]|nr:AAA family ATPase [Lachnospiraceae bacterium]